MAGGTALLGLAGTSLTFGLWWAYHVIPSELVGHRHDERVLAAM
ncbi:hypothetical protein [Cellulomonas wangsupingiae]|uniref:Uncharacterized protein n=1 Tax=Cellulomonas wangsupingiae TaxID=2968085 RepID=A0ABY5K4T8_9CELL|nr:hypothetical protein [Cellulomonas wangsupingiae]UUI64421.1 hypothetical protein NP075_15035 [Cellulomonas wangsupingiae]